MNTQFSPLRPILDKTFELSSVLTTAVQHWESITSHEYVYIRAMRAIERLEGLPPTIQETHAIFLLKDINYKLERLQIHIDANFTLLRDGHTVNVDPDPNFPNLKATAEKIIKHFTAVLNEVSKANQILHAPASAAAPASAKPKEVVQQGAPPVNISNEADGKVHFELRALKYFSETKQVYLPLVNGVILSNDGKILRMHDPVMIKLTSENGWIKIRESNKETIKKLKSRLEEANIGLPPVLLDLVNQYATIYRTYFVAMPSIDQPESRFWYSKIPHAAAINREHAITVINNSKLKETYSDVDFFNIAFNGQGVFMEGWINNPNARSPRDFGYVLLWAKPWETRLSRYPGSNYGHARVTHTSITPNQELTYFNGHRDQPVTINGERAETILPLTLGFTKVL